MLYNYYHQVRRIGVLAIRGHSWTGRRWWKSLNPAYLSTRYGNDSLRERIYIIYYILPPPPPRTDGSSASIDYPHGGRARLENRPGLNAGSARGGRVVRWHIWRGVPDTKWIVAYACRARVYTAYYIVQL